MRVARVASSPHSKGRERYLIIFAPAATAASTSDSDETSTMGSRPIARHPEINFEAAEMQRVNGKLTGCEQSLIIHLVRGPTDGPITNHSSINGPEEHSSRSWIPVIVQHKDRN